MKKTTRIILTLLLIPILTGCFPKPKADNTMGVYYTSAAGTISVALTVDAQQRTMDALARPSSTPEDTATPTMTATITPTDTPSPDYNKLFPSDTPQGTPPEGPTTTVTMISETPTDTPGPLVTVTAKTDTACRSGSGYTWPIKSSLLTGQQAEVHARIADNTWFNIVNPADKQGFCWVWAENVSLDGDIGLVPVWENVPTPKPDIPDFTVQAFAYPTNYIGKCPMNILLTGYIFVKEPSIMKFEWMTTFGSDLDPVYGKAKERGYYQFTTNVFIDRSIKGSIRLKMVSPVSMKSDWVDVKVHCSNKKN
jgi:hypothetical protein